MLVILCWWQFSGVSDDISILIPDAFIRRYMMLVTKTVKTVTNILKFSATHSSPTFVTNIDVAILKLFQTSILSALKRWRNGCLFSWMAQLHPRWNGYQQPTSSNTHQYIEIWPARPRDCPFTVMIDDWKITIFAIYLYI